MTAKAKDLRELSDEELRHKYDSTKEELYQLNCKVKLGSIDRPSRITELKKDIARILTVLKEKGNEAREEKTQA